MFNMLRVNLGGELPDDFVTWLEVLTGALFVFYCMKLRRVLYRLVSNVGGEGDMLVANNASGYNFGTT